MKGAQVAFLAGAYPPRGCGAEDYTALLAEALERDGLDARVFAAERWSLAGARRLSVDISRFRPDVLHVQYPTMGYGKSLAPQALALLAGRTPLVTTLHEFSTSHVLRKVADLPFALRSQALVFTNEHERRRSSSWFPWTGKRSLVIPIGSNVPFRAGSVERDPLRVVYFGLIRPHKGLEDFLELARLSKNMDLPYRFMVVGEVADRYGSYPDDLMGAAKGLPIEWRLGLSASEVAEHLAGAGFAYAPFPDGASERRGSLLAVLGNGAATITTRGPQTPESLREAALFAESPSQALELLGELSSDPARASALAESAMEFARGYSWASIATAHHRLYSRLLEKA